jgi:hypothetical protein
MQENDIYVVDTRNADHRTPPLPGFPYFRPNQPVRTMTAQPAHVYAQAPQMYSPPTHVYSPPTVPAHPQIIYASPPQHLGTAHVFGKMSAGQLIDMVAQVFAALMPLPAKPATTSDAGTDVGNLILYQDALAQYAKRDEQVRTLGNLVTKLLG